MLIKIHDVLFLKSDSPEKGQLCQKWWSYYCLACLVLSLARVSGNVWPRRHSQHTVAISRPACWQILTLPWCAVCHRTKKTLCGISNTCDSFRFQVQYKFVDYSSKKYQRYSILILVSKLSLILIAIVKFKSNTDSDIDTDTDTLISLPHHAPVGPNS